MTTIKLTESQTTILTQAAYRPDGDIEPLPPTLRGGARTKVIDGLTSRGLIVEQDGKYLLTADGYAAIGRSRPQAETPQDDPELEPAVAAAEAQWQGEQQAEPLEATQPPVQASAKTKPRTRENSKQAQVVAMLKRVEGATIPQVMAATGWQAHTVRGTFAGAFKKKLGLNLISEKTQGGERVYHIA